MGHICLFQRYRIIKDSFNSPIGELLKDAIGRTEDALRGLGERPSVVIAIDLEILRK